jgi:hypothetical protein
LVAALEVRAGDMLIFFPYNPFTNQALHRLLKKSQSAQFADACNKKSLPKQTSPQVMNSSFCLKLEVLYAISRSDTPRSWGTLDFFAGRAARPAASPLSLRECR